MTHRWHCDVCEDGSESFYEEERSYRPIYIDPHGEFQDVGDSYGEDKTDEPVRCGECDEPATWEDRSTMAIMGESIDETPSS